MINLILTAKSINIRKKCSTAFEANWQEIAKYSNDLELSNNKDLIKFAINLQFALQNFQEYLQKNCLCHTFNGTNNQNLKIGYTKPVNDSNDLISYFQYCVACGSKESDVFYKDQMPISEDTLDITEFIDYSSLEKMESSIGEIIAEIEELITELAKTTPAISIGELKEFLKRSLINHYEPIRRERIGGIHESKKDSDA